MRKEMKNLAKKTMAGFLATVVVVSGVLVSSQNVEAAVTNGKGIEVQKKVTYVPNEELDLIQQIDKVFGKSAPTKEGYFFGGWYADEDGKTPIKTEGEKTTATTIYAKFVPAYVLSVKSQNHSTTKTGDEKTNLRIVSSVDSLEYESVGFDVYVGATQIATVPTKKVYSSLQVTVKEEAGNATNFTYEPTTIFGDASAKLIVFNLNNVDASLWNADTANDIYVRPYWTTYDGVKVQGIGKYVYVQDGLDGWISVPVSLHTGTNVAAGILSVTFPEGLEYKGFCEGKVFEEMDAAVNGNTVKCVGNVDTASDGTIPNVSADDMYITLRFKVTDGIRIGDGKFRQFTVSGMDFCNADEEQVSMNVMNIQY